MALDSTLKRHDSLMPQRPGGMGKGTAMALLVHVGLLIALAFGVSWRSQTPAGVSAELWSAVPQIAAPPAAPPQPKPAPTPPAPKPEAAPPKPTQQQIEAQIAIEKEKAERKQREQQELERKEQQRKEQQRKEQERQEQERREQERIEREKAQKLAAQKQRELEAKRQKEEEVRQAKQREENLKRIQSQAGTGSPDATGTAVRESGPSASYAGRIIARVKPNIVLTDEVPGNPVARVEVRCAPDGTIIGRRLVKSSGNKEWDDAVLRAIDRTEVLPRDIDGRVPSSIEIDFRPRE
ncbi:MAG TPA: cell envelope integrity protein TolA [Burkholderiaceae bacterium]|nr:cell envelope integrity protein TolA [Burkholderiaceae bacterium]